MRRLVYDLLAWLQNESLCPAQLRRDSASAVESLIRGWDLRGLEYRTGGAFSGTAVVCPHESFMSSSSCREIDTAIVCTASEFL